MKSIGNITPVRENSIPQPGIAAEKNTPAETRSFLKPMVFKNGEVLRGTVLESLGANNFLLALPSGTLEAQIDGQFRTGAELMLRVISTEGKMFLKAIGIPVSNKNPGTREIFRTLGIPSTAENLAVLKEMAQGRAFVEFESLKEVFNAFKNQGAKFPHIPMQEMVRIFIQMQSAGIPLHEKSFKKLSRFFRYGGSEFSGFLKNSESGVLRALLLNNHDHRGNPRGPAAFLSEVLENPGDHSAGFLKDAQELLELFEAKEIVNLYAAAHGLPLFALLFLAVENEFHLLKVRLKREGRKGRNSVTVFSFLLNLPKLGELEVDGRLADAKMSLNVTAAAETIRLLRHTSGVLKTALQEKGIELGNIYFRTGAEEHIFKNQSGSISMTV